MAKERILKKAGSDRSDSPTASDHKYAGNPYGVKNVNVAQGERVGLMDDKGKRRDHLNAKAERAPLANVISEAFSTRANRDYERTTTELDTVLKDEMKKQSFSKAKSKYRD